MRRIILFFGDSSVKLGSSLGGKIQPVKLKPVPSGFAYRSSLKYEGLLAFIWKNILNVDLLENLLFSFLLILWNDSWPLKPQKYQMKASVLLSTDLIVFILFFQASPSLMFCWRISEYPMMLSWGFKLKFVSFQEDFFSYLFYSSLFFPSDIPSFFLPCTQSILPVPARDRVNWNSGIRIIRVSVLPYGGHAVDWPSENTVLLSQQGMTEGGIQCVVKGRGEMLLSHLK